MGTIVQRARLFFRNRKGASLVEYGVALLVVVIVGTTAMITLGTNTNTRITEAADTIKK